MGANEPTMGRREAMLQLLRLAGAGEGTAAAFWLREQSRRPTHALAANAKRDHTIKSNAAFPELAVVQGDDPRALVRRRCMTWVLQNWLVFDPFLDADKIINLPIAKHHALTGATLGFKNWFGILGGQRNRLHQQIHPSLVDLAAFMLPTLTLLDCYRVLLRNGPTGGDLEDVALKKTLVAGTDPVALDAYAAKAYWNLESDALPYLKLAEERGLGRLDFEHVRTKFNQV